MVFENGAPLGVELRLVNPPQDDDELLSRPGLNGMMDAVLGGCAMGWAFDRADPRRRVRLDLFIDGKYHDTFAAMLYRKDLANHGAGDGYHAFRYPLPPHALDGQEHKIEVRYCGTQEELRKSPRVLVIGAAGEAQRRLPLRRIKLAMDGTRVRGRAQPRLVKRDVKRKIPQLTGPSKLSFHGISVIIPTFNRGALLEETLRVSMQCTEGADVEFIVIDDGSRDDTSQRLARLARTAPNLKFESIRNGGPGQARNHGMRMAKHELVLFQGDDIQPSTTHFYLHHIHAHRRYAHPGVAVLGKITWPDVREYPVSFVMSQIQGMGHQQFGYFSMMPYQWLDWRFFYTSNVSMKKSCVAHWERDGFNAAFTEPAWEDAELAYRLGLTVPGGFGCLYCPGPVATHHHAYTARQFVGREMSAGRAARTFTRLHPRAAAALGLPALDQALAQPWAPGGPPLAELLSIIEGLKAWPSLLETRYDLGSRNWHGDLLTAVFRLSFLQGYVMSNEDPDVNYEAAYAYILRQFEQKLGVSPSKEAFGRFPPFMLV